MVKNRRVGITLDWKPDAEKIRRDFDRDGYIILRNHLSAEETAQVRENVDRYMTDVLPGLPNDKAFYEVSAMSQARTGAV